MTISYSTQKICFSPSPPKYPRPALNNGVVHNDLKGISRDPAWHQGAACVGGLGQGLLILRQCHTCVIRGCVVEAVTLGNLPGSLCLSLCGWHNKLRVTVSGANCT